MNNTIKRRVKCSKCSYIWDTKSQLKLVSCPSCGLKQKVVRHGFFSVSLINEIYNKYNYRCDGCASLDDLEVHHVEPVLQGGKNVLDNLQLLCHGCHMSVKKTSRFDPDRKRMVLNVYFEDAEYELLLKKKGKLTWHDFVLEGALKE